MTIHKNSFRYFFFLGYCLFIGWGCNLEVIPPMPEPQLIADFDFKLTPTAFAPCSVEFTNTSSPEARTFKWYNNGVPFDNVKTPQGLRYTQPGTYSVKLVAIDSAQKDSASVTKTITVQQKKFEKTLSAYGIGKKVLAMPDGGFIIAGQQLENGSSSAYDVYLIKVDADGNPITSFNLLANLSTADDVSDLVLFSDGSIGVIGTTLSAAAPFNQDILYARASPTGSWVTNPKRFGTAAAEIGLGGSETTDGWAVICGALASSGTPNGYMVSRSFDLILPNPTFDRVYTSTNIEYLYDMVPSGDGGFMAVGTTKVSGGLTDPLILRTDSKGAKLNVFPKSTASDSA